MGSAHPVMLVELWRRQPILLTMFSPPKVGALGEVPARQWVLSLPKRITKQSDGSVIYRLNKPLANGQSFRILFTPHTCIHAGKIQIIAVIQDKPVINKILKSVGEATEATTLSKARGPPSWDDYCRIN